MRTTLFFILLLPIMYSCHSGYLHIPDKPAIYDLASPIRLKQDTTVVYLTDYFLYPEYINKITPPENTKMWRSEDHKILYLLPQGEVLPLNNLSLRYQKEVYDIPVLSETAAEVTTGPVPEITNDRLGEDTVYLRSSLPAERWAVYFRNYKLKEASVRPTGDGVAIIIPREAAKLERGELRIWAMNKTGVSNDILIPLEKGKVITDAGRLTRFDKRAATLYFLMVDRFQDAVKENNHPLNSPEVLPIADYMGGDIAGVTQKLKEGYFEQMGINTIWLSPITRNPESAYGLWKNPRTKFSGYHGYWPVSSSEVDYRYGRPEELKELVEAAHERNINVILDYVANHVHEEHPLYKEHKEWATDLYLPDGSLNTERWDDHRLTTWFDTFLPTLDLERKEVYEPMSDSALFWIKEYQLDGFRHDATKHIPEVFWRTLTMKLKREVTFPREETIYQVGETYGDRELIASYVGSGLLDGQFDFNVYDDAVPVFALPEESFQRLNRSIEESFRYYGVHNMMSYISGNQDRARFISYAAGDVRFNEDAKAAGWSRKIGERKPSDNHSYDKLVQLLAFNATIPGIPVIYYGDEIGMTGGNDPDNRRMMRFDQLSGNEQMLQTKSAALNHLRRSSMPLMYGDFIPLRIENQVYAYLRSYFGKDVVVVFNKGKEPVTLKLDLPHTVRSDVFKSLFGGRFSYANSTLILDVQPNGVEVIYN